jgi:hypothetical protein
MQSITLWIAIIATVSGCASHKRSPEPVAIDRKQACINSGYKPGGSESNPYCDQFFAKPPIKEATQESQVTKKIEPPKTITPRMRGQINQLKKRLEKL